MLRKAVILDISVALGESQQVDLGLEGLRSSKNPRDMLADGHCSPGLGTTMGYLWWYGTFLTRDGASKDLPLLSLSTGRDTMNHLTF